MIGAFSSGAMPQAGDEQPLPIEVTRLRTAGAEKGAAELIGERLMNLGWDKGRPSQGRIVTGHP